MTPEQILHTYARRYCIERQQKRLDRLGLVYDRENYHVFPGCEELRAILEDVESLDFDQLPSFGELSELLMIAAQTASTGLLESSDKIERDAAQEERNLFADAVREAIKNPPTDLQRLHYRRTLSPGEVEDLWRKLRAKWGITDFYWYPLNSKTHSSLLAFDVYKIDRESLELRIKEFFKLEGIDRILQLREFNSENCCIEAGIYHEFYSGFEGYWFSEANDWIFYCSHHGTITLGGTITAIAPPNPLTDRLPSMKPPTTREGEGGDVS